MEPKCDFVFSSMKIMTPSIASNGNLYFCSSERKGEGSTDIFISEFTNGIYAEPRNLGNKVNSKYMEAWIHIAPDESYLLFSSFGRPKDNGVFISTKNSDGSWSKSKFITEINENEDERFVKVSPNGKYIFFNRQYDKYKEFSKKQLTKRDTELRLNSPQNGKGDIYWISSKILDGYR